MLRSTAEKSHRPVSIKPGKHVDVSPDGNRLLVSDEYQKDSHAQPAGLSLFDLTTQQSTRLLTPKALLVGEGCWLGERAVVLPGVTLGPGCVVGAGAVVTRSFAAGSVVAGVPAKLLRKRQVLAA